MATKNRKPRRKRAKSNPRSYGEVYRNKAATDGTPATASQNPPKTESSAPAQPEPVSDVDWATEYAYVFNDLRQVLLVSTILFVGLLAVGYFI